MPRTVADLTEPEVEFLTERHLGTLTTIRPDGSPHVVAIAFVLDRVDGIVRIISSGDSQKVRNVESSERAAVCQVDGRRWLTLEGTVRIDRTSAGVDRAVAAFESRSRPTKPNPQRVAIEIAVDRVLGKA